MACGLQESDVSVPGSEWDVEPELRCGDARRMRETVNGRRLDTDQADMVCEEYA